MHEVHKHPLHVTVALQQHHLINYSCQTMILNRDCKYIYSDHCYRLQLPTN